MANFRLEDLQKYFSNTLHLFIEGTSNHHYPPLPNSLKYLCIAFLPHPPPPLSILSQISLHSLIPHTFLHNSLFTSPSLTLSQITYLPPPPPQLCLKILTSEHLPSSVSKISHHHSRPVFFPNMSFTYLIHLPVMV